MTGAGVRHGAGVPRRVGDSDSRLRHVRARRPSWPPQEGPVGAFCMGIFTTLLATPCSGPFLGPVFGYTISQPPVVTYLVFGSVGVGMALPYLLIGAFPSLVSWLPKPGEWMDTLKQLLGFVLLATVVYLFSTINPDYFLATLALVFSIWFGCWIIGRAPAWAEAAYKRREWLRRASPRRRSSAAASFALLSPSEVAAAVAALLAGGAGRGAGRRQDGAGRLHRQLVPHLQDEPQAGDQPPRGARAGRAQRRRARCWPTGPTRTTRSSRPSPSSTAAAFRCWRSTRPTRTPR